MDLSSKFLGLLVSTLFVFFSLSGCSSKSISLTPEVSYGNPSYEHVKNLPQVKYKNQISEKEKLKKLPEKTADEYEILGDALLARGEYFMAYQQYEKSLEKEKNNIRIEYKKGLTFLGGKRTEDAGKQFKLVLNKQPDHALAHEGLGKINQLNKNYEIAKINFQKAIALDPLLWNSYNRLGNIYDREKKHKQAIKEYRTALTIKSDAGSIYNNLGYSLYLTEQNEEAVKAFYKALELNYTNKKVYNNLGMVFAKMELYDKALEVFQKGGTQATAYNNLGVGYLKNNAIDKAVKCFSKAIEISPQFYAVASENLKKCRALQKYSQ